MLTVEDVVQWYNTDSNSKSFEIVSYHRELPYSSHDALKRLSRTQHQFKSEKSFRLINKEVMQAVWQFECLLTTNGRYGRIAVLPLMRLLSARAVKSQQ